MYIIYQYQPKPNVKKHTYITYTTRSPYEILKKLYYFFAKKEQNKINE